MNNNSFFKNSHREKDPVAGWICLSRCRKSGCFTVEIWRFRSKV